MKALNKRVIELQQEADKLVNQREDMYKGIRDIEIRLHQIVGAIQELTNLSKNGEKNESDARSESTIPASTNETK